MEYFYWLDHIQAAHRSWVGDKAFYLSLLKQQGHLVVPGVVVSAPAFRAYLETIHWADPLFADLPNSSLYIDVDNPRQLQAIAQQIRRGMAEEAIPEAWLTALIAAIEPWQSRALILRPSIMVESDAATRVEYITGLLQAQVCWAKPEAIAQSLRQVWSELFRAKSLLYWQRLGVQLQQVHLAVLIQPIDSAIASGTLSVDANSLEVRAVWGLGKSLIDGIVGADVYQADLQRGVWRSPVQIGTKRYLYGVGTTPTSSMIQGQALSEADAQDCLRLYPVASEYQHQAILGDRHLDQLMAIAHQVMQEWRQPVCLEWVLSYLPASNSPFTVPSQGLTDPQFYLTQIVPYATSRLSIDWEESAVPTKTLELLVSQPPEPDSTTTVLTGLSASHGQVLAPAWVVHELHELSEMPANAVLIVAHIQPQWVAAVKSVAAIVTEQGGLTSHGALLAREMGIPVVVGVVGATQKIQSGDVVFVDGDRGSVYRVVPLDRFDAVAASVGKSSEQESVTRQSQVSQAIATQLMVNVSQTQLVESVAALSVDGVGLLRSELMMREILREHPQIRLLQKSNIEFIDEFIEPLSQQIQCFAQGFAPRPVFYRSLDLRSHEMMEGDGAAIEANPTLGMHGTFSYQANPALFEIELAALRRVQQAGYDNLRLILPFVRTVEEFQFCRDRVVRAGLTQNAAFQLWIMAEVPSALFLIPEYVQAGVQGISIGSNDLTQLMLAVDRDHPHMTEAFNQCHPAVLRAIKHLIQAAKQARIPCSICGQAPVQYPELIELLVEWGITAISVSADAVGSTYTAIARAERKLLLKAVRKAQEAS